MKRAVLTSILLSAVLLSGCSGAPAAAPSLSKSTVEATSSPTPVETTASPTPTPTPEGLQYLLSCSKGDGPDVEITDYRAAWPKAFDSCAVFDSSGEPTAAEAAAGTASGGSEPESAVFLYALCATTTGHYFEGKVSTAQAKEIAAALTLCPDHPKKAALQKSAGLGVARDADAANGKLAYSGTYLVGKEVQPGTWRAEGDKVENCYWETRDASGNIIANGLVSGAPFTIAVPSTASALTIRGCGFRWISG